MTISATPVEARVDRAAAVRHALRTLVARNGLHGASMSAVAKQAGVATGTAYVHYESKKQLLLATYLEVKREMGEAAVRLIDPSQSAHDRFIALWKGIHDHLAAEPERARFMVQLDSSPYAANAHSLSMAAGGDPIMALASAPNMVAHLAPLEAEILYDLGLGPAVRLAARITDDTGPVDDDTLKAIAEACWRAVSIA